MPRMADADYALSNWISPRARRPEDNQGLRELYVMRLSDTLKAAGRAALRSERISIFCEGCKKWTIVTEFPLEWDCRCGRSYRAELVVYEEVVADGDES